MREQIGLWLAVSLGGAMGTAARFAIAIACKSLPYGFPAATLIVNVVGGFAMGAIVGQVHVREVFPDTLRLTLTTGVLGGFTTFSAFSIETLLLWRDGQWVMGAVNIAANVVLSIAACAAGYWLSRSL